MKRLDRCSWCMFLWCFNSVHYLDEILRVFFGTVWNNVGLSRFSYRFPKKGVFQEERVTGNPKYIEEPCGMLGKHGKPYGSPPLALDNSLLKNPVSFIPRSDDFSGSFVRHWSIVSNANLGECRDFLICKARKNHLAKRETLASW